MIVLGLLIGFGVYNDATTPDNPFESDPITVGTEYEVNGDYSAEIETTLDYWERNDGRYGNWTGNWSLEPNAENPDVELQFVREINSCGYSIAVYSEFTGCAPIIDNETDAEDMPPVTVKIAPYDTENVTRTMMHEWGHLYGLEHGMEPMPLMDAVKERGE